METDKFSITGVERAIRRIKSDGNRPAAIRISPDAWVDFQDTLKILTHPEQTDDYARFVRATHPSAVGVLFGLPVFVDLSQEQDFLIFHEPKSGE